MFEVELLFHGDLSGFLRRELRDQAPVSRMLNEKTSVKDITESCGIPHTEVDLILLSPPSGVTAVVDFSIQLDGPARLGIHSVASAASIPGVESHLQVRHWSCFVADGHLGKLVRNLRLLGVDTVYERYADDRRLLDIMAAEDRALLTRDRRLLMHSQVRHGYCPRSADAEVQTREVVERFSLLQAPNIPIPYSRCLLCNHPLEAVEKADVLQPLAHEPRTLQYYDTFRRCTGCGRLFLQGTHFEKLAARLARFAC